MIRKILLVLVVVLVIAGIAAYPKMKQLKVDVPAYEASGEILHLEQGWNPEQRAAYHYTAQGTRLMPYQWFMALEQPCFFGCEKFSNPEYLGRFGFLEGDKDLMRNPGGLPVGLARQEDFFDPDTGKTYAVVGLTCAACHTGELRYGKYAVRIEGGVAMIQPTTFQKALGTSLVLTKFLPWRYKKFEEAVLGANATSAQREQLKADLSAFVSKAMAELEMTQVRNIYPNDPGFGRTDALTKIGNQVFGSYMGKPDNYVQANSPVRFPQVWEASWFTWVQYNGSIGDPLVRNIGEALGVRAPANLRGSEASAFRSSVSIEGLTILEELLAGPGPYQGLRSPKWPDVFPRLDASKVAAGEKLYQQHCASCHLPAVDKLREDLNSPEPKYWVKNEAGKHFLNLKDVPVDYVGTDPRQAIDFIERKADTGDLGKGQVTAGEGLELVTKGIRDQYFAKMSYTPEQKLERMGYRATVGNAVRSEAIYKARPLSGVWATAPYLHNGSVPSLFQLISSKDQRGKPEFWPGTKRYDTVKVGYEQGKIPGTERFDYSLPGNSNEGHYFQVGTRGKGVVGGPLSDAERWALVEYLKSL